MGIVAFKGLLAACVAGAIGAALWGFLSATFGVESGFVAWGIGGLVGVAVHLAVGPNDLGPSSGAVAVLCAALAILAGKYIAVDWALDVAISKANLDELPTEEDAQLALAHEVSAELAQSGSDLKWPAGITSDTAERPEDFPEVVWRNAMAHWNGLSEPDRMEIRETLRTVRLQMVSAMADGKRAAVFKDSFSPFDILWAILALGTAWRLATEPEIA